MLLAVFFHANVDLAAVTAAGLFTLLHMNFREFLFRNCLKSILCGKLTAIGGVIRAAKRAQGATHVAVHGAVLRAPWGFPDSLSRDCLETLTHEPTVSA